MDELDRAFLHDYMQFGYMNHIVAAIGLFNAGARADETAAVLRGEVERVDAERARAMVAELGDATRVQKIVVAKLMAEFAGAVEDFGALCSAIRHRKTKGISRRYVDSSVGEAAEFFDHILAHPDEDLAQLLRLPDATRLQEALDSERAGAALGMFAAYPERLRAVAEMYRTTADAPIDTLQGGWLPSSEGPHVHILLGGPDEAKDGAKEKRNPFVLAANKIKHRFVVIEDPSALAAGLASGQAVPYIDPAMHPERVERLYHNIIAVALSTVDVAALVLALDEAGLLG
ncbi:MAG: hypothetical protein IT340_22475 [Chloroflexi bacterium]|nr:hypothetical protein [Chloroflexota bacterium]